MTTCLRWRRHIGDRVLGGVVRHGEERRKESNKVAGVQRRAKKEGEEDAMAMVWGVLRKEREVV
jgi:hypothetical protein